MKGTRKSHWTRKNFEKVHIWTNSILYSPRSSLPNSLCLNKDSYIYGRNTPHWSLQIWNCPWPKKSNLFILRLSILLHNAMNSYTYAYPIFFEKFLKVMKVLSWAEEHWHSNENCGSYTLDFVLRKLTPLFTSTTFQMVLLSTIVKIENFPKTRDASY